ncbi:MAG: hypothetical protein IJZ74_10265 [Clostridia bacterium]|nr:hypothetical protein [Clostridia bacterium]
MRILLPLLMLWMLLLSSLTMDAAAEACRLFVTSVMPGLFPYMVLSLMLVSRFSGRPPAWLFLLLGWGGGSPTGARLLYMLPARERRHRVRMAVSCATMSPMFLLGTAGEWLGSRTAGTVLLGSVLLGGYLTGWISWLVSQDGTGESAQCHESVRDGKVMSFGGAIDLAARTMLLVCGTMVMLRVLSAMASRVAPDIALLLTTFLEVTTGVQAIAALPLPLALRTALVAGATGFGGAAILLQNRTMYGDGFLSLPVQIGWQTVHGGISFVLALGVMQLLML